MLLPDAAHWLIVLCSAVFGGAIGSFLNVVVYRLPHGISLITPPSHCPNCKRPIRWFDNVPVFGWIMLRGRCRHCRCPISIRYPAVEAFTAAMFAALAAVENPLSTRVSVSFGAAMYVAVRRVDEDRREPAATAAVHSGPGRGHRLDSHLGETCFALEPW